MDRMPRNVMLFERLMYTSLAIGILNLFLDGIRLAASAPIAAVGGLPFVVFVCVATAASLVLFIWLIARRRQNWARWVFLVLFVIGLVPVIQNLFTVLEAHPAAAYVSVVQLLLQQAALFFIFTGDAGPWFSKVRPA
jgi:hypothetical protein